MTSAAVLRRFDGMLARAVHLGTPVEEARTALDGARAVLRGHPDIPRGQRRVDAAAKIVGLRMGGATIDQAAGHLGKVADAARDVAEVIRRVDGSYTNRYR
jgi:hypothetical protein